MAQKDKVKELVGRSLNSYHTKSLQQIDRIEKKNKEQNHKISILSNELDNDYLTKTEEGSVISLEHSKEGMVYLDELQGNTLVNYCTDGSKEMTLNGDIDIEGTFVTTTEGVDNGKVDVMCEGSTLVNLISKNWSYGTFETKNNRECLKIEKTLGNSQYITNVKSGSTYTLIYDYISTELINGTTNPFGRLHLTLSNQGAWVYDIPVENFGSNNTQFTRSISVFTIPTDKQFTTLNVSGVLRDIDGTVWIDKEILLLEGDWTNKEIPPYFEGMKSVGQDDENGHKFEILSQNKNLLTELQNANENKLGISSSFNNNILTINGVATGNGDFEYQKLNTEIFLKKNTDYTLKYHVVSGDSTRKVFAYKINKLDGTSEWKTVPNGVTTFNSGLDIYSISRIRFYVNEGEIYNNLQLKVQLEEGNVATEHIQGKLNKKEISLNEPLRGLPNGVKDRFVKQGGKWYIERKCGECGYNIFTEIRFSGVNIDYIHIAKPANFKGYEDSDWQDYLCLTDYSCIIPNVKVGDWDLEKHIGYMYSSGSHTRWYLGVPKGTSFDEIINKTKDKKIIYPLKTPTYEEIIDVELITYLDITHISNNSTIPCNMKIKNSGYNAIIKPSTQYTVALDTNKSGTIGMNLGGAKVTTTNNVATITTPATLTDDSLRLHGKGINASKVRLLERDKTNWIPSFFEGMKSSFEDKLQDDGTYKMEILSNNKNLFGSFSSIDDLLENKALVGNISEKNRPQVLNNRFILKGDTTDSRHTPINVRLKLKPNTTYTLSCTFEGLTNGRVYSFLVGSVYVDDLVNKRWKKTFTTDKNGLVAMGGDDKYKILLGKFTTDEEIIISNIQVVEGIDSEYIEPKQNKIQFSSIEPLRGNKYTKDRFVFKDGRLMIERNFGKLLLDGKIKYPQNSNEGIYIDKYSNSPAKGDFSTSSFVIGNIPNKINKWNTSLSNVFSTHIDSGAFNANVARHSIMSDHPDLKNIYTCIGFDNTLTLTDFYDFASKNPIEIVYQLKEPTYEEVPFELQKIILECYQDGTLFIDTNIPPTVTTTYSGETPIVKATRLNKSEVLNNTNDINNNIVPYLMDMDYRVVCLQLEGGIENISMARLFGGTYEMLQRDIQSKRYSVDEYKHRLNIYLSANKITEDEYNKLGDMLND